MKRKKVIWLIVLLLLVSAGIADAIRYLQSHTERKQTVQLHPAFPVAAGTEILLVYNAYGGIYPGIADFAHKIFSPASYPCNLCDLSFGNFGMKPEWEKFLETLPYKKVELHKDQYKRNFLPEDLLLPVILIGNEKTIWLMVNAAEINKCRTLHELEELVQRKLE